MICISIYVCTVYIYIYISHIAYTLTDCILYICVWHYSNAFVFSVYMTMMTESPPLNIIHRPLPWFSAAPDPLKPGACQKVMSSCFYPVKERSGKQPEKSKRKGHPVTIYCHYTPAWGLRNRTGSLLSTRGAGLSLRLTSLRLH